LLDRHILLAVAADPMGHFRREIHQGADGGVGAGVCALFQNLTDQHNGRDDRGGLEIERHSVRSASAGGKRPPNANAAVL